MNAKFNISLLNFKKITSLENAWLKQDYIALLEVMDYGDSSDLSDSELKEMCLLSLSDAEPDAAATIVLNYIFKDRLNERQIDNLSHEMIEEKMFEEYADLSLHEEFFNAHQILYNAYNGKFPLTEAVQLEVEISAKITDQLSILEDKTEAKLLRLLVQGIDQNNIISRLFEAELAGEDFKDAKNIIWQYKKEQTAQGTVKFTLISSLYFFHDFKNFEPFEAILKSES